ncbi:helix-turn-helix domain-containing protein [Bordetella avium]|uniref:LexA family protein n=1 Tax=Bordetella avium TaxID=521 RepID=UPI000E695AA2|nr:XRE family transcriptional regulator [Bordetella avium]RIQ74991.1 helix-turn-helix domain-containing protein [Bordetella avium]
MSTLQERIREAALAARISQSELARRLGLTRGAVSFWFTGVTKELTGENLLSAAQVLGVNPAWLGTGKGPRLPDSAPLSPTFDKNVARASVGSRRVPLINYVQAGELTEIGAAFSGEALEYLLTDMELSDHAFALEIAGLSMSPDFKPGDRIIVDQEVCPQPGDFVVARNGGFEATFKKYRPRGMDENGNDLFELVPLNDDYPTLYSKREQLIIIGTMMEHRRYYRRS